MNIIQDKSMHFGMVLFVSPINGMDMCPEVEAEELQPPLYKIELGRLRKVRIVEYGEDGAKRRRTHVSYKCTKCDKFGHNALSCKSIIQDPNALKIKVTKLSLILYMI